MDKAEIFRDPFFTVPPQVNFFLLGHAKIQFGPAIWKQTITWTSGWTWQCDYIDSQVVSYDRKLHRKMAKDQMQWTVWPRSQRSHWAFIRINLRIWLQSMKIRGNTQSECWRNWSQRIWNEIHPWGRCNKGLNGTSWGAVKVRYRGAPVYIVALQRNFMNSLFGSAMARFRPLWKWTCYVNGTFCSEKTYYIARPYILNYNIR